MRGKSDENWTVGQQCLEGGSVNAAANRLYYAVFQAVLGFAVSKKGYVYKGHGGHFDMAQVVLGQGKYSKRSYYLFKELMGLRETADYEPETPNGKAIASALNDYDQIRQYFLKMTEN